MKKQLAITAISGNEEKWVEQWCKSVLKANPRIVVINLTQYGDHSEKLFKSFIPEDKLVFVKYPWQKSFSEARNRTHDALKEWEDKTGEQIDYCFFIDLDEIITEDSYKTIDAVLNTESVNSVLVTIYNTVGQKSMLASLYYPRMYAWRKNGKRLNPAFEGTVHNQLIPTDSGVEIPAIRTNISLMHYGYALDDASMAKKHLRSEELLRNQIDEDKDNYFPYLNLAQLLRAKNDHAGTYENATIARQLVKDKIYNRDPKFQHAYIMASEQMATACVQLGRSDETIELSTEVLKLKPDHLDSIVNMANAYLQKGTIDKAKFWLNRYLFIRGRYDELRDNTNLILNHLHSTFLVYYHLGNIALHENKLREALDYYSKSLKLNPEFNDTITRYLETLRRSGDMRKLTNELNEYITKYPDTSYKVYEWLADVDLEYTNLESAKFNYWTAVNLSENQSGHDRIAKKWNALLSLFGDVAPIFFDTEAATARVQSQTA